MAFPLHAKQMLEWLILPALVLIVVLAIVTAKPKSKDRDEGPPS